MATATLATPRRHVSSKKSRTNRYVAVMVHMAALYAHEPEDKKSKEHRTWEKELQEVWNESCPALFESFPDPTAVRLRREDLEHLMQLALDLVKGGITYRDLGSPTIIE